jgi:Zn ribbon nucleic-acid-binding protein
MEMMIRFIEGGDCPNCSGSLTLGDCGQDGMSGWYEFTCDDCSTTWSASVGVTHVEVMYEEDNRDE